MLLVGIDLVHPDLAWASFEMAKGHCGSDHLSDGTVWYCSASCEDVREHALFSRNGDGIEVRIA